MLMRRYGPLRRSMLLLVTAGTFGAGLLAHTIPAIAGSGGHPSSAESREEVRVLMHGNDGQSEKQVQVIRSREELRAAPLSASLMERITAEVSFPHSALVVVHAGTRTTGGYTLSVGRVHRTGETLLIEVQETPPAPGALVTQALTYPCIAIVVPNPPPVITVEGPAVTASP